MENASKALIIAAEVLIGVLLLTLMVVIFNSMGLFSKVVDDNIDAKNIYEFNIQFEIYNKRKDLTAQDVITIGNIAKNYNFTQEDEKLQIKILLSGTESKYKNVQILDDDTSYEFIKKYSVLEKANFECTKITYNENNKKIQKIEITLLK